MLLFFVEGARIRKEYDESSSRLSKIQSRISSLTEKLKHDFGKYDMLRFCFDLMKSDGSEYHKLGCLFFTLIYFLDMALFTSAFSDSHYCQICYASRNLFLQISILFRLITASFICNV